MCYCPTPTLHLNLALTGDGAFLFSPQKTHSAWFISILNYGDTENVLINHLLFVIPMSYLWHYTNLCPHKPHKHAHTHTHTHTHTLSLSHTHTHTHTHWIFSHAHTRTHTHTHTHTHKLCLTHAHTLSLSQTHTHTLSHIHTDSLTHAHTLSLSHTHTHSLKIESTPSSSQNMMHRQLQLIDYNLCSTAIVFVLKMIICCVLHQN